MDTVIDLGKLTFCRPAELLLFLFLEPLKLFDEIQLEFCRDPARKLEGNILMRVNTAVVATAGNGHADGARLFDPLLRGDHKGV